MQNWSKTSIARWLSHPRCTARSGTNRCRLRNARHKNRQGHSCRTARRPFNRHVVRRLPYLRHPSHRSRNLPERLISAESQGNAENVIIPHPGTVLRNTEDNLSIALNRPFWAIKRAIDFPVALSAANLLSPITLIVSALVLLDVGVPSSSGSSVWGAVERDSISISFAPYNLYSTDKPRQGARQHNLLRSGDSCKEHALMNCPSCTTFFQEIGL